VILGADRKTATPKPGILNLFQTWRHIHSFLSTSGPQGYKQGEFIKTPWQFDDLHLQHREVLKSHLGNLLKILLD
jgi:hypothetical protein